MIAPRPNRRIAFRFRSRFCAARFPPILCWASGRKRRVRVAGCGRIGCFGFFVILILRYGLGLRLMNLSDFTTPLHVSMKHQAAGGVDCSARALRKGNAVRRLKPEKKACRFPRVSWRSIWYARCVLQVRARTQDTGRKLVRRRGRPTGPKFAPGPLAAPAPMPPGSPVFDDPFGALPA